MGWVWLALLGAAALAALALLGVRRALWSMIGSALMLGAAGYALQGRPQLPASLANPDTEVAPDGEATIELRNKMLGRFSGDGAYLIAADAMTRAGDRRAAVRVVLAGISKVPESVLLWTGLGSALVAHDGGQVSPGALFAFQQAARLSPRHPAPPFFLGEAYVRAGEFETARRYWARALALSPAAASYRSDVAVRLALLDRLIAIRNQAETRNDKGLSPR
ncbi:MAG TPA: hypothetical protein VM900_05280 [Sphingomonas sp.]|jgi:tetratricopeptide (TPR) repeat protein|nr:hypothetical protein [Sphingomonas sp.]